MISIGFQFDYELNSKNHSKKIKNVLDFFDFFDFFRFLLGFFRFVFDFLDFFWFFWIVFRFFRFFWIFFDFNWISIGFQLDFFGFQLDFNWIFSWALAKRQAWEKKTKRIEKNQKPNPKFFFIFLILIGSIPKSNRIEIQKNQNKIKKNWGK